MFLGESIKEQTKQKFDSEVEAILDQSNYYGHNLLSYINIKLILFNLNSTYSSYDILSETYIRGVKLIASGQTIAKPIPWFRVTSLNVIREISRNQKRQQLAEYTQAVEDNLNELVVTSAEVESNLLSEEKVETGLDSVLKSFQDLEPGDQRILELRLIEGLTWKQVGKCLVAAGEKAQSIATLRKRGQRALERLRKIYHSTQFG